MKRIRLAYSAFAYANPPFWIAQDLKLFEKYGLDSELVYVSGARPIQAMLGGSIDVSQVGGAATYLVRGRQYLAINAGWNSAVVQGLNEGGVPFSFAQSGGGGPPPPRRW